MVYVECNFNTGPTQVVRRPFGGGNPAPAPPDIEGDEGHRPVVPPPTGGRPNIPPPLNPSQIIVPQTRANDNLAEIAAHVRRSGERLRDAIEETLANNDQETRAARERALQRRLQEAQSRIESLRAQLQRSDLSPEVRGRMEEMLAQANQSAVAMLDALGGEESNGNIDLAAFEQNLDGLLTQLRQAELEPLAQREENGVGLTRAQITFLENEGVFLGDNFTRQLAELDRELAEIPGARRLADLEDNELLVLFQARRRFALMHGDGVRRWNEPALGTDAAYLEVVQSFLDGGLTRDRINEIEAGFTGSGLGNGTAIEYTDEAFSTFFGGDPSGRCRRVEDFQNGLETYMVWTATFIHTEDVNATFDEICRDPEQVDQYAQRARAFHARYAGERDFYRINGDSQLAMGVELARRIVGDPSADDIQTELSREGNTETPEQIRIRLLADRLFAYLRSQQGGNYRDLARMISQMNGSPEERLLALMGHLNRRVFHRHAASERYPEEQDGRAMQRHRGRYARLMIEVTEAVEDQRAALRDEQGNIELYPDPHDANGRRQWNPDGRVDAHLDALEALLRGHSVVYDQDAVLDRPDEEAGQVAPNRTASEMRAAPVEPPPDEEEAADPVPVENQDQAALQRSLQNLYA